MMDFAADVDLLLADIGEPCVWTNAPGGAVRGDAVLDSPGVSVLGGGVLATDYAATLSAAKFGALTAGALLTIGTQTWRVREALLLDDGALVRAALTKV